MKTILTIIGIFLMLSVNVIADSFYNETGFFNAEFTAGRGRWNENLNPSNLTYYTKSISERTRTPLVTDMNSDGIKEIIAIVDTSLVIYHEKNLNVINSLSISLSSTEDYSNILAFNIDGGNDTEIIFVSQKAKQLKIIGLNGSTLYQKNNFTISTIAPNPEYAIKCMAQNDCMAYYSSGRAISPIGSQSLAMTYFNSSSVGGSLGIDGAVIAGKAWCLPNIRNIEVSEMVNLGEQKYIISGLKYRDSTIEQGWVYVIDSDHIGTLSIDASGSRDSTDFLSGFTTCETSNLGQYITSPMVFDFQNNIGGNEILFGLQDDLNEFIIYEMNSAGVFQDRFPEVSEADGVMISNLAKGSFFSEDNGDSVCVLGFETAVSELNLYCANKNAGLTPETRGHFIALASGLNFTSDFGEYNTLIHSVQYSNILTDNQDLNEVLSSLGTLKIQESTCLFGICDLERTFNLESTPDGDNVIIPIDLEDTELDDLLMTTSTNIIYLDDGFSKSPSQITSYTLNPCLIDSVVQLNSSVQVSIEVTDNNGENVDTDLVSAKIIAYKNHPNIQDSNYSAFTNSGTTFQFFYNANQTATNAVLELLGKDNNDGIEDSIEINFAVGQNGVSFGDSTCSVDLTLQEAQAQTTDEALNITALDTDDNAVVNTIRDYSAFLKLGALGTFLALLFAINIYILTTKQRTILSHPENMQYTLMGLVIIDVLAFVLGAIVGIIPFGLIVFMVIIGIVIAGVWARSFFTQNNGGNI